MFAIDAAWIALLITGLGTLFLFGELLVNMRGVFGVLGLAFIMFYFMSHLSTSMFFIMGIVYLVSLLLIIIDGNFLNDGTLTTIGSISMLFTIGMAANDWVTGLYGVSGVLIGGFGSLLFLKVFPKRNMWSKITLLDQLSSEEGYNSMNESYRHLIGKEGITLTDLRPVGTVSINNQEYSVVSNGHWMKRNEKVVVERVDGTKILVKKVEN
ncbi:NfeD family protein [Pontibacillus salicampi]|uniref:NfeD family protein n=1 Tax=Pontibacillus salicampi TaxID=1449801 RepID=A0ABV6LJR8_9BACI